MKIYLFLAPGFEECEAMAPVDICRRLGIETIIVSVSDDLVVKSAHDVCIKADNMFDDCDFSDADMLVLPGGQPGSDNLLAHERLCKVILRHHAEGKMLAAICAAPLVYGNLGLLKGLRATCYPGVEPLLKGAITTGALVEKDGLFITAKGPGAAFEFGFTIGEHLCGKEKVATLRKNMIIQ